MKILFVNYEFPPLGGGGGTTSKFLAQHLAALGNDIKVLTASFKGLPPIEHRDGYEIIRVPCRRTNVGECSIAEMFSFVMRAVLPLQKIINTWRPDVLHVFFAFPTGPLGYLCKILKNKPYVVSLLGGDVPGFLPDETGWLHTLLKPAFYLVLSRADAIVANSAGLKNLTEKSFNARPVHVITNGIDLLEFKPYEKSTDDTVFQLLFVGRFVPQKGLDVLLQAVKELIREKKIQNIRLTVVGDGPEKYKSQYLSFIKDNALTEYVRFLGWVPLETLPSLYSAADVFILPSTFEGMASVVLQSLACGTPVISTRVFGSEDIIREGHNGFLLNIGDAPAIAEKIQKIMQDKNLALTMKACARESVKEYDWLNVAKKYETLYLNARNV